MQRKKKSVNKSDISAFMINTYLKIKMKNNNQRIKISMMK